MQDDRWPFQVDANRVFQLIEQDEDKKVYSLILDNNNNYNSDKSNYNKTPLKRGSTANSLISKLFKKISLKLDTKHSNLTPRFSNLPTSLCIVKGLTTAKHYQAITSSTHDTLIRNVSALWDDNNYCTTYDPTNPSNTTASTS